MNISVSDYRTLQIVSDYRTLQIGVRSGIYCHEKEMTDSLEIPLPQISSERSWTCFELVATAKEWNATKQLAVVPTLLRGKLIDYYLNLSKDERKDVKTLKAALQEEAGLKRDSLMASKLFNERL